MSKNAQKQGIDIEITGDIELDKTLQNIQRKFADKVVKAATSAGLTPIARKAKSLYQHTSLKQLVAKKAWKNKRKQITGKVYLNPKKTNRTITLEGREVGFEVVGNILEFGSSERNIKPNPVMQNAKEQSKESVKTAMVQKGKEKLKILAEKERVKK